MQKLNLLSFPVSDKEKDGRKPKDIEAKLPGALSELVVNQLGKRSRYNEHRRVVAKIYHKELEGFVKRPPWDKEAVWLRYPIQVNEARSLLAYAKKKGVLLGDWYKDPIYPLNDLKIVNYNRECKNVEDLENKVVNLPTYPTLTTSQANKVVEIIKLWQK